MRWKTAEYKGWGRVLSARGDTARPERLATLKALWKETKAPAIGNLRSYGDAALNDGGKAIDMTRLDRLIAFDPDTGILEAEAGITIGEIARIFAPKGWIPTVLPGTGFATLGGCISNDVHGKNHKAGSFGQHVISFDLLGANGRVRKVTPDATPELFRATCGGIGQTGVILSAKIQLASIGSEVMDVRETRVENLTEFMALLDGSTAPYCVGWIDATAKGEHLGRGILEEGSVAYNAPPPKPKSAKSVPMNAPRFFLSSPIVRLFNQLYLRRIPVMGQRRIRAMQDFFFPLDKVLNWNRLYGKPGFHQFQCALPDGTAHEALVRMMDMIASSHLASPLTVLKRMGTGRAGMMSFPMGGYSFALDFPNGKAVAGLVGELEEITLQAGGRIYLAKDTLATPEMIAAMYDELPEFIAAVNAADPEHKFATDMVRRLNLRGTGK